MRRYARIIGTGSYLPPRRLTNNDLAAELAQRGLETSDEWIVERTGIRARHFAEPDVTSSDLALEASRKAIEAAGIEASDIDLIIVATSTPDMVFPSTAAILQHKLGISNGCPAFDVQAVCSGFVYALTVADSMFQTGAAKRVLVVGSEVFSRILDFNDRTTCVLFGDGAGAVVLEASDEPGVLATELHADGSLRSVERRGRAADRAYFGNGQKRSEQIGIEVQHSNSTSGWGGLRAEPDAAPAPARDRRTIAKTMQRMEKKQGGIGKIGLNGFPSPNAPPHPGSVSTEKCLH